MDDQATERTLVSGFAELPIATSYKIDGKLTDYFPMTLGEVERAEPVYEVMPGWTEDVTRVRRIEDLPAPARDYVRWIEDELGVPADLIGVGPERAAAIERLNPFERG